MTEEQCVCQACILVQRPPGLSRKWHHSLRPQPPETMVPTEASVTAGPDDSWCNLTRLRVSVFRPRFSKPRQGNPRGWPSRTRSLDADPLFSPPHRSELMCDSSLQRAGHQSEERHSWSHRHTSVAHRYFQLKNTCNIYYISTSQISPNFNSLEHGSKPKFRKESQYN